MIKFEITEQDVQILGKALAAMPFGEVAGLVDKLQKQINEQKGQDVSSGAESKEVE